MHYEVSVAHVDAQPIASVRERVPVGDVPTRFGAALDRVWQFAREAGLATHHNVFVYHDSGDGDPVVEFGVQIGGAFDDSRSGGVLSSSTPAGVVARAVHVGPYDGLRAAHDAVRSWCADHGHTIVGPAWEIYGDWDEDPAKLETEILYRLAH
jgi:effector-binding domain-containing protein